MYSLLSSNALKASQTYKGADVAVVGCINNIDSDGKYFSLKGRNDTSILSDTVLCDLENDAVRNQLIEFEKGDLVTVKGYMKNVGESLGYSMEVDEITEVDPEILASIEEAEKEALPLNLTANDLYAFYGKSEEEIFEANPKLKNYDIYEDFEGGRNQVLSDPI